MQEPADSPHVLVFPPLLFAGTMVVALILHLLWPATALPASTARLLGVVMLVLSALLAYSAQNAMKRAGTNIRPDQPTLVIVTEGPFRASRNPLYLAAIGMYIGIALLLNTGWALILLVPMFVILQQGVVRREERYLERKFGEQYLVYRDRVRRWV